MKQKAVNRKRRPELTTVGIRRDVMDRLRDYVFAQYPRPVIADVASEAIEDWLSKRGQK